MQISVQDGRLVSTWRIGRESRLFFSFSCLSHEEFPATSCVADVSLSGKEGRLLAKTFSACFCRLGYIVQHICCSNAWSTYIVLSTRGCSPWRPAAVISTTGYENHSLPWIFKGRRERTGHHVKCGALPDFEPYLQII